jgi:hypothetical protein
MILTSERKDTMHATRSAADWYDEAECAYCELHQGCAWCGNTHCVRNEAHGNKRTFSCQRCDFQVSFDIGKNSHHVVPGENLSPVADTMREQPMANLP